MSGQVFARRIGAQAVHHIVDSRRHAHGLHDFAQQSRGSGGFLRGLDDYRVAAGERRCNLPGHEQQGQIPRAYHRDDALGCTHRVVEGFASLRRHHFEELGGNVFDGIRKDAEIRRAPRDVDVRGNGAGLAGVGDFGIEKIIEAPIDLASDGVEHLGSLCEAHAPPRTLQRRTRRPYRGIDLRRAAFRDAAEQAAIDGGVLVEIPLRCRGHEGVIDKVQKCRAAHLAGDITLARGAGLMKTRYTGNRGWT